jgi:hypothetical protein
MAALIKDRNTPKRPGNQNSDPVGAGVKIHAGSIVVLNATNFAVPATTAIGLRVRGMAEEMADNTNGADGDITVETHKGVYRFENDGSITRAHIGGKAYLVDDQTLAATDGAGTRSEAGDIYDVDDDGVWIEFK